MYKLYKNVSVMVMSKNKLVPVAWEGVLLIDEFWELYSYADFFLGFLMTQQTSQECLVVGNAADASVQFIMGGTMPNRTSKEQFHIKGIHEEIKLVCLILTAIYVYR